MGVIEGFRRLDLQRFAQRGDRSLLVTSLPQCHGKTEEGLVETRVLVYCLEVFCLRRLEVPLGF